MKFNPKDKLADSGPIHLTLMDCRPGEIYQANWTRGSTTHIDNLRICITTPGSTDGRTMIQLKHGGKSAAANPGSFPEELYVHRPDITLTGNER